MTRTSYDTHARTRMDELWHARSHARAVAERAMRPEWSDAPAFPPPTLAVSARAHARAPGPAAAMVAHNHCNCAGNRSNSCLLQTHGCADTGQAPREPHTPANEPMEHASLLPGRPSTPARCA